MSRAVHTIHKLYACKPTIRVRTTFMLNSGGITPGVASSGSLYPDWLRKTHSPAGLRRPSFGSRCPESSRPGLLLATELMTVAMSMQSVPAQLEAARDGGLSLAGVPTAREDVGAPTTVP